MQLSLQTHDCSPSYQYLTAHKYLSIGQQSISIILFHVEYLHCLIHFRTILKYVLHSNRDAFCTTELFSFYCIIKLEHICRTMRTAELQTDWFLSIRYTGDTNGVSLSKPHSSIECGEEVPETPVEEFIHKQLGCFLAQYARGIRRYPANT